MTDLLLRLAQHDRIVDLALPAIERAETAGHGEAMFVHLLRSNAAEALLEAGDLARAATLLDPLAQLPPTRDSCFPYMEVAQLNVYRGRLDDAARFWTDAAGLFDAGPGYDTGYNVARRRLELDFWRGDPLAYVPATLELFEAPAAYGELMLWGDAFVGVLRALAEAAQDARLTRDPVKLAEVAQMYQRLDVAKQAAHRDPFDATQSGRRVAPNRDTWRAELTRYDGASDPDAWAMAGTACTGIGCPFAAGYARWRQAEALLADRGRRTEATPVLRAASAEASGHVPLSTAINALARRARIDLSPAPDPEPPARESRPFGLTDREYEVLKLVGLGLTNAEIGRTLFISAKTVSVHVTSIMRKLGVSTRVQASTTAARTGLLD